MCRTPSRREADGKSETEKDGEKGDARRNAVRLAQALSEVWNPGACPQSDVRMWPQVRDPEDEVWYGVDRQ